MLLIKIQIERYLVLLKIRENGGGGGERGEREEREADKQVQVGRQTDSNRDRKKEYACYGK